MVEAGFLSYCRVDVLQEFFANSPDLAFGRVNKSARGSVLKVVFVVLECDKACRSAIRSARSAMFRLVAMSLASLLIALIVLVFAFL